MCLMYRINSLEEWRANSGGGCLDQFTRDTDDPVFYNRPYNNVSGVTLLSDRINRLEQNVSYLGQVTERTMLEMVTIENNLSTIYRNTINLANFSSQIYTDIVSVRKRIANLEKAAIKRMEQDFVKDGIELAKGIGQVAKSLIEWVPVLGEFVNAGSDYIEGAQSILKKTYNVVNYLEKNKIFDAIQGASDTAKAFNKFISEGADEDPQIGQLMATTFVIYPLEAMNYVKGIISDAPKVEQPILSYYLRPFTKDVPLISHISRKIASITRDFELQKVVSQIPLHGFIVIEFPMSATQRRQVVVSVGMIEWDFTSIPSGSFFEYVDRYQEKVEGKWIHHSVAFSSPGADIKNFENEIDQSDLMEAYTLKTSYNFIMEFLACMRESESDYSVFSHNCQHMSREIINFCVAHIEPHWWGTKCSLKLAVAELDDMHGTTPFGKMVKPTTYGTNYLGGNFGVDLDTTRANHASASRLISGRIRDLLNFKF